MKLLIFSDIHSNLEAFTAMFESAEIVGYDRAYCCGDLCGYGTDVNSVIEKLRSLQVESVMGNHDEALALDAVPFDFNSLARAAIEWQSGIITDDNSMFLRSLPAEMSVETAAGKILIVHGSPHEQYDYLDSPLSCDLAAIELIGKDCRLCFTGHTHSPLITAYRSASKLTRKKTATLSRDEEIEIVQALRRSRQSVKPVAGKEYTFGESDLVIINSGAAGQPRDCDPRGCYVEFDDELRQIVFRRFEYPYEITAKKIIASGLPKFLATRLSRGL